MSQEKSSIFYFFIISEIGSCNHFSHFISRVGLGPVLVEPLLALLQLTDNNKNALCSRRAS